MKKANPIAISFVQAIALTGYIFLVSQLLLNGEKYFGSSGDIFGPVLFLLLFIISATICGAIVFGYPLYLSLQKKAVKEAIFTVGYTIVWLLLIFFITLILLLINKN